MPHKIFTSNSEDRGGHRDTVDARRRVPVVLRLPVPGPTNKSDIGGGGVSPHWSKENLKERRPGSRTHTDEKR